MKRIFFILLLFPVLTFAQSKGDNKIIVIPSDTTDVFAKLVTILYDKGYSLEKKDADGGLLITDAREVPRRSVRYKIRALVRNGMINLTATINVFGGTQFGEVWWTKGDSLNRWVWDIVDTLAKELGTVSYGRD